jgi:hypothetical protein
LLAAGPGRLKASRSAIGTWSALSKSRFDWVELGLRTTAQVSVIDFNYRDLGPDQWRFLGQSSTSDKLNALAKQESSSTGAADATASWLALLRNAGFAYAQCWKLRLVATDYLPADVQAAPASASVMCLVVLMLVSDSNLTIDHQPGKRFVRVQGSVSQLTMREHPILGPVSVYETYGEQSFQMADA